MGYLKLGTYLEIGIPGLYCIRPNGAIVDARFTIMNYNGNKLVRIGEWFNSTTYIMENKITWFGTDQPDDRANSIRTVLKLGVNSDPPFIIYKKDNYGLYWQ